VSRAPTLIAGARLAVGFDRTSRSDDIVRFAGRRCVVGA